MILEFPAPGSSGSGGEGGMPVRGGDRQQAPAAGATARKPMQAYSEWPDEALKIN